MHDVYSGCCVCRDRVDYCNAVSIQVTRRLQMVLDPAARLVVGAAKFDHITAVLRDVLHWLPLPQQIQLKVSSAVFDCPLYRTIPKTSAVRLLRSLASLTSVRHMLLPRTRTEIGRITPAHFRLTSISLGQFRSGLKIHVFVQAHKASL